MKKLYKILLCCILTMSIMVEVVPAYATTKPLPVSERNTQFEVTQKFKNLIEDYFNNRSAYIIIDKEGKDISNLFYKENNEKYHSSDFNAIRAYAVSKISCFSKTTLKRESNGLSAHNLNDSVLPYASSQRIYVSQEDNYIATVTIPAQGTHSIDCKAELNASFVYNINTGVISSCSNPTLSFSYESVDSYDAAYLDVYADNVSTSARIASNKYSVQFTAYYDVVGSYNTMFNVTFARNKRITMTGVPE